MKKFFFGKEVYDIKSYDSNIHSNIKCEDQECRVPIVHIPHPKHPYFRVKHGLEHESVCSVCSEKTKKGSNGSLRHRIVPRKGLNIWNYGKKTKTSEESEIEYKKEKKKGSKDIKEYSGSDKTKVGIKNEYLGDLESIKKP